MRRSGAVVFVAVGVVCLLLLGVWYVSPVGSGLHGGVHEPYDVVDEDGVQVVCMGDSLTSNVDLVLGGEPYPYYLQVELGASYHVDNVGTGGVDTVYWIGSYGGSIEVGVTDVVVLMIGVNDLQRCDDAYTIKNHLATLVDLLLLEDVRVVLCTILPAHGFVIDSVRVDVNNWILSLDVDGLYVVDMASEMCISGSPSYMVEAYTVCEADSVNHGLHIGDVGARHFAARLKVLGF